MVHKEAQHFGKSRMWTVAVLLIALASAASPLSSQAQYDALMAMYNSTGGGTWKHRQGWPLNAKGWQLDCAIGLVDNLVCVDSAPHAVVTRMKFTDNNMVGALPANLFTVFAGDALTHIHFEKNPQLVGAIPAFPPSENSKKGIQFVGFSSCGFTSFDDTVFVKSLVTFELVGNNLSPIPFPAAVSNSAPSLTVLMLGNNRFTGPVSSAVCDLHGLITFNIDYNQLTSLPTCMGKTMPMLNGISILANKFTGAFPQQFCNAKAVKIINIADNDISGDINDSCLKTMPNLNVLIIEHTLMSGKFPDFVFDLGSKLVNLVLSQSLFHGPITNRWDELTMLGAVTLMGNPDPNKPRWTGKFPSKLFKMRSLFSLFVEFTDIVGPLPQLNEMQYLTAVGFGNNPNLRSPFPTELLKDVWTKFSIDDGKVRLPDRQLHLEYSPFYGTLPTEHFTPYVPLAPPVLNAANTPIVLYNLSSSVGAFTFHHCDWSGFVPEALLGWVPVPSQRNLLVECPKLLSPVPPNLLNFTGGSHGMKFEITSTSPSLFGSGSGVAVTVRGSNFYALPGDEWTVHCGFCVTGGRTSCAGVAAASTHGRVPSQYNATAQSFTCDTPKSIQTNETVLMQLIYTGPTSSPPQKKTFILSKGASSLHFYNSNPMVNLHPSVGRPQGCSKLTMTTPDSFKYMPSPVIVFTAPSGGKTIVIDDVTVVNETTMTFLFPFADAKNIQMAYKFGAVGQNLTVQMFPDNRTGFGRSSVAAYGFETTCGGLTHCSGQFSDPEQCPTPLCLCQSHGACHSTSSTTPMTFDNRTTEVTETVNQCSCSSNFRGAQCSDCTFFHFGSLCQPCNCGHGACDWGAAGSGDCRCDKGWMGDHCTVDKALVIGLCAGAAALVVIAVAGFFVRRSCRGEYDEDDEMGNRLNR
jgi:hypothetical protein